MAEEHPVHKQRTLWRSGGTITLGDLRAATAHLPDGIEIEFGHAADDTQCRLYAISEWTLDAETEHEEHHLAIDIIWAERPSYTTQKARSYWGADRILDDLGENWDRPVYPPASEDENG